MNAKRLLQKKLEVDLMLNVNIWGRKIDLEVVYDCYAGEEVLPVQKDSLELFISKNMAGNDSKNAVENYCLENNQAEIGADKIENIFKYVMPESLFVKRDGRIVIMCNYKFDPEHGIAVVFEDGIVTAVGHQDIIL